MKEDEIGGGGYTPMRHGRKTFRRIGGELETNIYITMGWMGGSKAINSVQDTTVYKVSVYANCSAKLRGAAAASF
jgi:hypothetical protein